MKTTIRLFAIVLALLYVTVSPLTHAQCPQICDDNANTALGDGAFISNTFGSSNTAIGGNALFFNTFGSNSTAIGFDALFENTTGFDNAANGYQALFSNTTGFGNVANGYQALMANTHGDYNTADGNNALFTNIGSNNTATGAFALAVNTTGSANTAVGVSALAGNTTGGNNIALGFEAGARLTTGINNIDIGSPGLAGEANTIRIGKQITQRTTFIAGISGATVPTGVAVIIDTDGHLGTVVSSERFKDSIKPINTASEAIFSLKPVTFRYKHDLDPAGTPQFGLVAEDVEKVNPDLVARDEQGKPYTVRYEAVNAMLLNEFLKAHRKIEEQECRAQQQDNTVAELKSQVQALTAALNQQAGQIQKVRAQLELSTPVLQTIANNQ